MTRSAITADALSKRYRIGTSRQPYGRLTESISESVSRFVHRGRREDEANASGHVWALRDVPFDIEHGEVVGVIGSNGAGKTTLLKILSRITEPTSGQATSQWTRGALLEVAAGFHHELTGRENSTSTARSSACPVLRYGADSTRSSLFGVLNASWIRPSNATPADVLRLAFAVAAHLETDVLIVDEVLPSAMRRFSGSVSGGWARSELRPNRPLRQSQYGRDRSLCQRALVLDGGRVVFDGAAGDAVGHYLSAVGELEGGGGGDVVARGGISTFFRRYRARRRASCRAFRPAQPSTRRMTHQGRDDYEVLRPISGMRLVAAVRTQEGEVAFRTTDHKHRPNGSPWPLRSSATIPGRFLNRRNYVIVLSFEVPAVRMVLGPFDILTFTVSGPGHHGSDFPEPWQVPYPQRSIGTSKR